MLLFSREGKKRRESKLIPVNFKSPFLHKWYLTFYVCVCVCGSVSNQCFLKDSIKESTLQHKVSAFWANHTTSGNYCFPSFSPGSYLLTQHDEIAKAANRKEKDSISNTEAFVWEYRQCTHWTGAFSLQQTATTLTDRKDKLEVESTALPWAWRARCSHLRPIQDSSPKSVHFYHGLLRVLVISHSSKTIISTSVVPKSPKVSFI